MLFTLAHLLDLLDVFALEFLLGDGRIDLVDLMFDGGCFDERWLTFECRLEATKGDRRLADLATGLGDVLAEL